ncbi:ankyrin repeat domain-containing protein [Xanthomonas rydalmerensis]|uniref:Ankyrin repeat domain-containing protein n=1 Tax=Xanthomonas rydalmerensis TaxID=3046274 RepID=A0ABZ0JQI5_9XANT|nr:ankyrin repeat domain-containing protein [Xanthomonas sp. DM-2023]WOS42040.1 ankyrin repeat domain-containing protein [Xanthomonas sp. DM-2023]WOS46226.1 ankyrin repeat domain-containing protein [Xanthomonas sp. DM-2023]WOS50405.1 ankyrin repeat domain-containing protein [Xanthomonas sp. DM-2023]WOS54585.1 ankyrin repeat domain-containing protein [Xanthomonas sp. DM-2023]WOS58768.1 ankyrin repeat domain-containing protein [Xanthomonas sp. DM-2023]
MNGSEDVQAVLSAFRQLAMFEGHEVSEPESPGMDGDTPLHIAAMDGDIQAVELFIPFVRNIDIKGGIGSSPLHYAARWGHPEVAKLLLRHGADINLQDDYGDTPLSFMKGQACFDAILLEQAAKPVL